MKILFFIFSFVYIHFDLIYNGQVVLFQSNELFHDTKRTDPRYIDMQECKQTLRNHFWLELNHVFRYKTF